MNAKLDEGWKLTDYSCPVCNFSALVDSTLLSFFCCKCDKSIDAPQDDDEMELNDENQKNNDSVEFVKKVPDVSKILGELLLKGWTMLQDHCETCGAPLMKDKAKAIKCVNPDCSVHQIMNNSKTQETGSKMKEE